MAKLASWIDRVARTAGRIALAISALCLLLCFALIVWSVGMRYFLHQPVPWVDEAVGYLLVAIVMLAAADTLRKGEHVAIDIATQHLGPKGKRLVAGFGLVAILLVAGFFLVEGWQTAAFSRDFGMRSTGYLSMPLWLPQSSIAVGGALLGLAAIAGLARLALGHNPGDDR